MEPTAPFSQMRWLVELIIPGGTFAVRPVVTERTAEQLRADIHTSVADLLAWQTAEPYAPPATPMAQQQQTAQPPRRLLLAFAQGQVHAMKIAADLRELFPVTTLPWNQSIRKAFDAYLQNVLE